MPYLFSLDGAIATNTIPMALLQSVKMLTGRALVVHAATNFLLHRDFEGVEFNLTGRANNHRL